MQLPLTSCLPLTIDTSLPSLHNDWTEQCHFLRCHKDKHWFYTVLTRYIILYTSPFPRPCPKTQTLTQSLTTLLFFPVSTTTEANYATSSAVTKHKHSTQSLNWQHLLFSFSDSKTTETDQCNFLKLCPRTQTLTVIYKLLSSQSSPRPKGTMQLPPLSQNTNTQYSDWTDNTFFFLSQTPKRPK